MYKLIASMVFCCSMAATTASAADMNERFDQGSSSWSGVYVGGALGYGWVNDFNGFIKDQGEGVVYGGFVGFNHQLDENIVVGLEAEISRYNIPFELAPAIRIENGGSVRARVGYAWDQALLYTTAGMSYATTNINLDDSGFVFGAGVDYKVTDNIIFGVEYQRSMYRDFANANIDADFDILRARLSYKFQ